MKTLTKIILTGLFVLVVGIAGQDAEAVPPAGVRGIDLPTALVLYDRTRQVEHTLDLDEVETRRLEKIQTIVLDPGHGGANEGAYGVAHVHEKFLTLELAYELRDRIQRKYPNVRVILTRYWDCNVGLTDRIAYANEIDADLFLSLHYNAAVHSRAVGYETYFLVDSEATPGKQQVKGKPIATSKMEVTGIDGDLEGKSEAGTYNDSVVRLQRDLARQRQHRDSGLLAETVQGQLARNLRSANRGVKQANFAVLRGALMPAVVVESGFLSHPNEGQRVTRAKHRGKVVRALLTAIERFDATIARRDHR